MIYKQMYSTYMEDIYGKQVQMNNLFLIHMLQILALFITKSRYICDMRNLIYTRQM
jgi:hypothetical protein